MLTKILNNKCIGFILDIAITEVNIFYFRVLDNDFQRYNICRVLLLLFCFQFLIVAGDHHPKIDVKSWIKNLNKCKLIQFSAYYFVTFQYTHPMRENLQQCLRFECQCDVLAEIKLQTKKYRGQFLQMLLRRCK